MSSEGWQAPGAPQAPGAAGGPPQWPGAPEGPAQWSGAAGGAPQWPGAAGGAPQWSGAAGGAPQWSGAAGGAPQWSGAAPGGPPGAGADLYQNWGLATPGGPPGGPVGPPPVRPGTLNVALVLACVGVVLSGVQTVLSALHTWQARNSLAELPPELADSGFMDGMAGLTVGLTVVFWVAAAVGTVVCAELARRGANVARIVLACLAGLFTLANLCGLGSGLLSSLVAANADVPTGAVDQQPGWSLVASGILAVLAVIMLVLLLVPSTNRYFSHRRYGPAN